MVFDGSSPARLCPSPDAFGDLALFCGAVYRGDRISPARFDVGVYLEVQDFLAGALEAAKRSRLHAHDDNDVRLALTRLAIELIEDDDVSTDLFKKKLSEHVRLFTLLGPHWRPDRAADFESLIDLGSFLTALKQALELQPAVQV